MVYCGKPSRGCQMCRQRRIKCDEGKPTCQQCQKSRRVCPGYKDDFDLVFRNETQATERRARKSNKKIAAQTMQKTTQKSSDNLTSSNGGQLVLASAQPSKSSQPINNALVVPIRTRATNFFLANFVLLPQPGQNRAWLDYVIPLIQTEPADSPLQRAFSAVAIAAMGNRPNAKRLLLSANDEYTKALRMVNNSLRDPALQKSDATLAAVMLLGMFEVITSRRSSTAAWGSHIQGAVMLVKMRGRKQLRTKLGQSLFIAIRTQMIVSCLATSRHPDLGVDWWMLDAMRDPYSHRVTKLHLLVTDLRAQVNETMTLLPRTAANIDKVLSLMNRAQAMDREYSDFLDRVPPDWRYETVAWEDNVPNDDIAAAEVCPGKVDLYSDIFIASVWNNLRVSRLLLGGLVIRCSAWLCNPVDYRTTPEFASLSRLGAEMITDICASMPFSLGWKLALNGELISQPMTARYACGDDGHDSNKGLGGYMAIWPLFSCSCSDFATDIQRKWILGRLHFIAETMGIDQAKTFAHYQLRLPSMIIKRDSLGLLSSLGKNASNTWRAPTPPRSVHSPARNIVATSTDYSSDSSYTTSGTQLTKNAYVLPPNLTPQTYPQSLTPPYRSAVLTPTRTTVQNSTQNSIFGSQTPIPSGSKFGDNYQGQSKQTFAAAPTAGFSIFQVNPTQNQYQDYSQNTYTTDQNYNHAPYTNGNQFTSPATSNYSQTPHNNFSSMSDTFSLQTLEQASWDQMEADRIDREFQASERERLQREAAFEKEKEELVKAAAGENGTSAMKESMMAYLAIDGVSLGN